MKVWRIQYGDDACGSGIRQEWFASKVEAEKRLREVKDETYDDPYRTMERVTVPANKNGLISFLNRYAEIS